MILIKNASLVNVQGIKKADLLIQNDRIVRIGKGIDAGKCTVIDGRGKYVFPGFIDLHTHLRTPGREDEEDLLSGAQAAAKGGFTTVFCMPNTNPPIDHEGLAQWIVEEGRRIGLVDIYPVGAVTEGRRGVHLTEFEALRRAGCLSLSDDGSTIDDTLILRRALEYAKMADILIISHCEDRRLSDNGVIRESLLSSQYGMPAIAGITESLMVSRDIAVAGYLGTRIHLAHISTARSVEIIRQAKQAGVRVTAETAPHYFALTLEDIAVHNFNSNFKVSPPLGTKQDAAAIQEALKEGVIDCIATDHAPHSPAEKELPFEEAPFGMIGLETAFALTNTCLVKKGILDISGIAKKLSFNPARITGLGDYGEIKEGGPADLAVADLNKKWVVSAENMVSKSKNTPFIGRELEGVIEYTVHRGKITYKHPACASGAQERLKK